MGRLGAAAARSAPAAVCFFSRNRRSPFLEPSCRCRMPRARLLLLPRLRRRGGGGEERHRVGRDGAGRRELPRPEGRGQGNQGRVPLQVRLEGVPVPDAKPWSPDAPHLHTLTATPRRAAAWLFRGPCGTFPGGLPVGEHGRAVGDREVRAPPLWRGQGAEFALEKEWLIWTR